MATMRKICSLYHNNRSTNSTKHKANTNRHPSELLNVLRKYLSVLCTQWCSNTYRNTRKVFLRVSFNYSAICVHRLRSYSNYDYFLILLFSYYNFRSSGLMVQPIKLQLKLHMRSRDCGIILPVLWFIARLISTPSHFSSQFWFPHSLLKRLQPQ